MTWFIIVFTLCMLPFHSYAAEDPTSIYTVQIGSHRAIEAANEQFNTITKKLNKGNLDYLRIEKIGKFYTLRLGKFDSKPEASKFLASVRSKLPSSLIKNVYFIEERIERMYMPQDAVKEVKTQQPPIPEDVTIKEPGETKPPAIEPPDQKIDNVKEDVPIEEKITSISSLVHKKNYNGALEILKKEIREDPENPELNAWYGTVLLKTDNPEEALPYMEKAVELSPSVPDYYNGLGYCLFYLDRHDQAVDAFNTALSLEPEHVDALAGLGIIYAKRGEKEKAMDIYNKLKNLDESSANKLMKIIEGT